MVAADRALTVSASFCSPQWDQARDGLVRGRWVAQEADIETPDFGCSLY